MEHDWMEEARVIAAQCWCDEETKDREMDVALAEAVAKRIAAWMQTGASERGSLRRLHSCDPYCPSCGHNRDRSSVSSIANDDGTRSCQKCGATWGEFG